MDKDRLTKRLQALANGKEAANTPLVEAYLADENTKRVARVLERSTSSPYPTKTALLPPSSCLPLLD